MLIAYIYKNFSLKNYLSIFMFIIGVLFLYLSHVIQFIEELPRFLKWGLPSFLIVLSCLNLYQFRNRFFNLLGNASYSIYLIQVFSLPIIFKFYFIFNNADVFIISSVTFTVILGVLLYFFFERPITNLLKNYIK